MAQALRTPQAEVDLLEIWVHIAESGFPDTADRFLDLIDEKCQAIAAFPEMGQARPTLAPNLRSFPVVVFIVMFIAARRSPAAHYPHHRAKHSCPHRRPKHKPRRIPQHRHQRP